MVAVIDYGCGNLGSLINMCKALGVDARLANDSSTIHDSSHLIFPGVGSFDSGMNNLLKYGLVTSLEEAILQDAKPVLGICLGAQLMLKSSEEGTLPGLGWLEGHVRRFPVKQGLKVPHMGWNSLLVREGVTLFAGMPEDPPRFYFVHGYYLELSHDREVTADCFYGQKFAASFRKGNIQGVQFHPEKSHQFGMRLLKNFLTTS